MNEITGAVTDDTTNTLYSVLLIADDPATVILQEHQAGRLRSCLWLDPAAAVELGGLLVAIATDAYAGRME